MRNQVRPGGEIDSLCTKCKRDTVHRIVAVVGGEAKRVECLSCGSQHNYRPTKEQKEAKEAHKRASKGSSDKAPSSTKSPSSSRSGSVTTRKRDEDLREVWEKAIAGKAFDSFKPYRIDSTFTKGDLIRHNKFGEGVVSSIVDERKLEILFREGYKTLAQGTSLPQS